VRRARRKDDLMPPGKQMKRSEAPKNDLETRLAKLEEQCAAVDQVLYRVDKSIEAIVMCLQAAGEMESIDFDLALFRAALNKSFEFMDRGQAGEFEGMANDEILEKRYAEFKAENFEE
jgi:hypothetical protein